METVQSSLSGLKAGHHGILAPVVNGNFELEAITSINGEMIPNLDVVASSKAGGGSGFFERVPIAILRLARKTAGFHKIRFGKVYDFKDIRDKASKLAESSAIRPTKDQPITFYEQAFASINRNYKVCVNHIGTYIWTCQICPVQGS